ncbi:MAG: iron-sulfur cluster assembly protein [Candidatus Tokpelaia sp. JSC085]|nr:MAG: iron-sulfur cluster assembly protein [Candidatus Tokpelaia sp. JSC085]
MSYSHILTLTDNAAVRVKEIMQTHKHARGIMVGIKKGGCAGLEYTIDLITEDMSTSEMDVIEKDGGRVFIAREAVLFLLGTEMDFEVTTFRAGFVFRNPNQISTCGCGESIAVTPASPDLLNKKR